jgi:hypothetical protein
LYKNISTFEQLDLLAQPVETASAIQCRTCHNAHSPSELLKPQTTSRSAGITASSEYNTCTNCHQPHDAQIIADPYPGTTTDGASGDLIYHSKRWDRVIASTHYDDPATATIIEGYIVKKKDDRSCRDCHDVHSADITINEQWAQSGHGGEMLEIKEAALEEYLAADPANDEDDFDAIVAIRAAGVQDTAEAGSPFAHYDWDASDRQSCQRCHTATGAKNYLTSPSTYDAANNDYSHLEGWSNVSGVITSSGQNEMLYCWACHKNNSGALRNPGAITADYTGTSYTYPDASDSNLCMACHTGRESGDSIKVSTANFANTGFINSHYLTAGGTLFNATGYEFTGQNFADVSYFHHDEIGMGTNDDLAAWEATNGTNGPCISCHMGTAESHLFLPVEETAGVISAITASVCVNCHDGAHGPAFVAKGGDATAVAAAADFLETEKEELHAALEALEARLARSGYFFAPSYPYFHLDTNLNGVLDVGEISRTNGVRNWVSAFDATGKNNMGAAFNYNLIEHDPGAYAHNRYYTKRLIYDSIDFLDNGTFDQSVGAAIDALVGQVTHDGFNFTAAEAVEAKTYLDADTVTAGVQRP